MKNAYYLIIFFITVSCQFGPEIQTLEYTASTKTIKILSKDYFIKSIEITECIPNKNFMGLVDSNSGEINTINFMSKTLNLENLPKYYKYVGSNYQNLINTKQLYIEVRIIKPHENPRYSEKNKIIFNTLHFKNGKIIAESDGFK